MRPLPKGAAGPAVSLGMKIPIGSCLSTDISKLMISFYFLPWQFQSKRGQNHCTGKFPDLA